MHPGYFWRTSVIDVGSLDINGNNRFVFRWLRKYIGIDIHPGKNVDMVGSAHEVLVNLSKLQEKPWNQSQKNVYPVDVVISTEMLEHDKHWELSLAAMYDILRPNGLLLITAGGDCRPEHGTTDHHPTLSPATHGYYQNISNEMFSSVLRPQMFKTYHVNQDWQQNDFQFFGIKKS